MSNAVIEARGLSRRFGSRHALADLDLSVARGQITGLLGANGAGKTTFLKLVTGLLLPSSGELRVAGLSPAREARRLMPKLGYAMEQARFYPELRVVGFLRFVAAARGLDRAAQRRAVEREVERFGLGAVAKRALGGCSKGMTRRVSLAQALLHEPTLLVLDEPSAGLDPLQRAELHALLAKLGSERSVLLSTHDLAEARALCQRVALLKEGRLVADGSPDLLNAPATQWFGGDA